MTTSDHIICMNGEPTKEPLHYKACGLDNVFLINGYDIQDDADYGRSLSIKDIKGLHAAIAKALVTKQKTLSGKEIRFIRRQLDFTQSELAELLEIGGQQVARWEKGESQIPGPADVALRCLYLLNKHPSISSEIFEILKELRENDQMTSQISLKETSKGWKFDVAA